MHRAGVGCTALAGATPVFTRCGAIRKESATQQGPGFVRTYVRKGISFTSLVVGLERALRGGLGFRV